VGNYFISYIKLYLFFILWVIQPFAKILSRPSI